jgi:hypothetical protein
MNEKIIERNLDEIPAVTPKPSFDALAYEGKRVKIAEVKELEVIDFYTGPKGTYNDKSTETKHVILIATEPLKRIDEGGNFTEELYKYYDTLSASEKTVSVEARLGLKYDVEKKEWIISKHPKAKLWKFMKKLGAEKLSELKNKYVTLTAQASDNPEDDRNYLRIVI